MSDRRDKLKSLGRSILLSVATSAQESLDRDAALSTLKIDIGGDKYPDVIGKLAHAVVELREENTELRAQLAKLRQVVDNR